MDQTFNIKNSTVSRNRVYLKPLSMGFIACIVLVGVEVAVIVSKAFPGLLAPDVMDCI